MFVVKSGGEKVKGRFNLLMLQQSEYYFQDAVCILHTLPEGSSSVAFFKRKKTKGRLHVSSQSLFFDSEETRTPVQRFPLKDIISIRRRQTGMKSPAPEYYFVCRCKVVVDVRLRQSYVVHNLCITAPESEFCFTLPYCGLEEILKLLLKLHKIQKSNINTQYSAITKIIESRENAVVFDTSRYVDLRESPQLSKAQRCSQISPLVEIPGCLMITDQRLYFQAFNNVNSLPVYQYNISNIKRIYKRRQVMRGVGLELYFPSKTRKNSNSKNKFLSSLFQDSVYLSFPTPFERDQIFDLIINQPTYTPDQKYSLAHVTKFWQQGHICNFDYLLFINEEAGRSFKDLTQYPVFPWVIADYSNDSLDLTDEKTFRDLSKPIGALNPKRLSEFKKRMIETPYEVHKGYPFLYGTHFSTPGYVLYFLVRKAPEYMLRLQNGKFDHPDRMFVSMGGAWHSVNNAVTDLKELIPEFYNTQGIGSSTPGDFLTNDAGLDLGVRANGKEVDDVELPPWADTPQDCIEQSRAALESEYVSQHLHHWIDLIFGFKQKGKAATKADNLFYYLTYEGAVDVDSLKEEIKDSIIQQINEFGQMPRIIFTKPHVKRGSGSSIKNTIDLDPHDGYSSMYEEKKVVKKVQDHESYGGFTLSNENDENGEFILPSDTDHHGIKKLFRFIGKKDGRNYDKYHKELSSKFVNNLGNLKEAFLDETLSTKLLSGLPSELKSSLEEALELHFVREVRDIEVKELNFDLPLGSEPLVVSQDPKKSFKDGTSSVSNTNKWAQNFQTLDCTHRISIHRHDLTAVALSSDESSLYSASKDSCLKIYSLPEKRQRRSTSVCDLALSSCCLTQNEESVLAGSWDNNIYMYSVGYGRVMCELNAHDDAVSCLKLADTTVVSGSWDATIKVWEFQESDISKYPLIEFDEHEVKVHALDLSKDGNLAVSGAEDGCLMLWDLRTNEAIRTIEAFNDAVTDVIFTPSTNDVICCSVDGFLKRFQTSSGKEISSLNCGETLSCVMSDGHSIVTGGEKGVIRIWNLKKNSMIHKLETKCGAISCMDISASGGTFVCGFSRRKDNLRVWQTIYL